MDRDGGAIVVASGEGREVVRVNGERTVIKAGRDATRGAYAVRENMAPPGFATVPLHIHRRAEEAFYVLSGRMAVLAAKRRVEVDAGSFVLIPRGTAHAIANPGAEAVRWLTVISPAEWSGWIEAEHDLLLASSGEPDPAALAAIHRRFALEIIGPPPAW
jgi:mannose-6-phosphate isomerase-like protein (cupin superfamily)